MEQLKMATVGDIASITKAARLSPFEKLHSRYAQLALTTRRLSPLTILRLTCIHRRVLHHGHGRRQTRSNGTLYAKVDTSTVIGESNENSTGPRFKACDMKPLLDYHSTIISTRA